MVRHLPKFRAIAERYLGVAFSRTSVQRIVVTQFEERGLSGRGGFFDTVGQARDMIQSHLLQVLAVFLMSSGDYSRSDGKLAILDKMEILSCTLGQYDGFLFEPGLKYRGEFTDATLCSAHIAVRTEEWRDVEARPLDSHHPLYFFLIGAPQCIGRPQLQITVG